MFTFINIKNDDNNKKLNVIWKQIKERSNQCLHKSCPLCNGTGRKQDGSACIHMIACPCPKCSPKC